MSDMQCPYCGLDVDVRHYGDGDEYEEDTKHTQECQHCRKSFVFTTSISFSYDAEKADCLNDGEHKWQPTHTYPIEATRMECVECGEERKPTEEEWKEIKGKETRALLQEDVE